ncbi:MAG: hypothetical protein GX638_04455, partial [Crenarchaeota archaeon]|nr:hypothetical protein [Thermoproteota archaeon]
DRFGVFYLEASQDGLNLSLNEAISWCTNQQADWIIILPADIPLLRACDINKIIELGINGSSAVLVPSADNGTNTLFQSVPVFIDPCFGPRSFRKHSKLIFSKGIDARFYGSLNVICDIDSADDLKKVLSIKNNTLCREALEQIINHNKTARDFFNVDD